MHISPDEEHNHNQSAEPFVEVFVPAEREAHNFPHPVNPWQESKFENYRTTIRFAVWTLLRINVLMAALFTIAFTYQFLSHLWSWCARVLFTGSW